MCSFLSGEDAVGSGVQDLGLELLFGFVCLFKTDPALSRAASLSKLSFPSRAAERLQEQLAVSPFPR